MSDQSDSSAGGVNRAGGSNGANGTNRASGLPGSARADRTNGTITPARANSKGCIGWAFILFATFIAGFQFLMMRFSSRIEFTPVTIGFLVVAGMLVVAGIVLIATKGAAAAAGAYPELDEAEQKVRLTTKDGPKEIPYAELQPFRIRADEAVGGHGGPNRTQVYYVCHNPSFEPYENLYRSGSLPSVWRKTRELVVATKGAYMTPEGDEVSYRDIDTPVFKKKTELRNRPLPTLPEESGLSVQRLDTGSYAIRSKHVDKGVLIFAGAFFAIGLVVLVGILSTAFGMYDPARRIVVLAAVVFPLIILWRSGTRLWQALIADKTLTVGRETVRWRGRSVETAAVLEVQTLGSRTAAYLFTSESELAVPRYVCIPQYDADLKHAIEHCLVRAAHGV